MVHIYSLAAFAMGLLLSGSTIVILSKFSWHVIGDREVPGHEFPACTADSGGPIKRRGSDTCEVQPEFAAIGSMGPINVMVHYLLCFVLGKHIVRFSCLAWILSSCCLFRWLIYITAKRPLNWPKWYNWKLLLLFFLGCNKILSLS